MITITLVSAGHDGRGLRWSGQATYQDRVFRVEAVHQVTDVLRLVVASFAPGEDSRWQLVRDGQADLFGASARTMAGLTVHEGQDGTVFRRFEAWGGPFYGPSRVSG